MTVSSVTNKFRFQGNGVTDTFAISGRIFNSADYKVRILTRATDAVVETLTETTDYTITINGPESASVVVVAGKIPTSTQDILIFRELSQTQTVDLPTGTRFPAVSVENALDRLTALVQDQSEILDRTAKLSIESNSSFEFSSYGADLILAWSPITGGEVVNSTKTLTEVEAAVDAVSSLSVGSGVLVSSNDTTIGFLNGKIVAGANITLTEGNDGGNETLTIAATDTGISDVVDDTTPQLGGTLDTNAKQVRFSKGADVESANALALGDDGNYFDITGTTSITSIGTKAVGTVVKLHFDAALTLTHHATDLILPGGVNITTAAGDEAEFVEYAAGDWRCTSYTKADGTPVVVSSSGVTWATPQSTATGTAFDFNGIPSTATDIFVAFYNVSFDSSDDILVQAAVAGTPVTSGYDSSSSFATGGGVTSTAGFRMRAGDSSRIISGLMRISLLDASNFIYVSDHGGLIGGAADSISGGGDVDLAGIIDEIRITRTSTGNFDGGTVNVGYI